MKKIHIISVLFGALFISLGVFFVRMIVDYYDETGSFYAFIGVPVVVYVFGLMAAIVLHPFFKEVASWIQREKKKDGSNDIFQ